MKKLRLKKHHFHTKLPYQKPMLRQMEWWVQNWPITKNEVLTVTTLLFWKFCFSLRTSYQELIWFTNDPGAHIPTFCKSWSFIWWCFFPVSILNVIWNMWECDSILKTCFYLFMAERTDVYTRFFQGTQRAHHVESTWIRCGYYVDTSKTKFRRISTSIPRTFSM